MVFLRRKQVDSSNILSIGYNKKNKILQIEFKGKTVYDYYDVEEEVYLGFFPDEDDKDFKYFSIGHYFDVNVKKAGYKYAKIFDPRVKR